MAVRHKNLVLVIFNERQLQKYRQQYYSSEDATILSIAEEMKAEAQNRIEEFDFIDFAETIVHQIDPKMLRSQIARHKEESLKRVSERQ